MSALKNLNKFSLKRFKVLVVLGDHDLEYLKILID